MGLVLSLLAGEAMAAPQAKPPADGLRPGEFTWTPELAPGGPVAVIVSLPEQRAYVYRNGVRIGTSTTSTGKPGTPPRRASTPSCRSGASTTPTCMTTPRCRSCSG